MAKRYNSELTLINKSEIKYSSEIGSNPQRAQLIFIERVDSVNLSLIMVFKKEIFYIINVNSTNR